MVTLGEKVELNISLEEAKNTYEELLKQTLIARYKRKNPDKIDKLEIAESNASNIITWLEGTDFFTAPASTRYHESFFGGLVYHTLRVYNTFLDIIEIPQFHNYIYNTIGLDSGVFVCLCHDWCKIGLYESYNRNVKNDVTGVWEKQQCFKVADNIQGVPLGHGIQSMFMANSIAKLTDEEACAIRWHMGWCQVCDSQMNDLQRANEIYPLVHALQFADQLAITKYNLDK